MFLIGFIIGFALATFCIALLSANHKNEKDDEEQARYLAEQKDRNEF